MNILVTGGAGFVGSNLTDTLINEGHDVVIVDNLATGDINNINPKARFINWDVRNSFDIHRFLGSYNPEIIYHIAALARIQPSFGRPYDTIEVNAQGTARVLDYARKKDCKVIYSGSSSFYFDPHINPYAHSKWIGEEHCKMYNKTYGLSVAIARFFNVYGHRHVKQGDNANVLGIFEHQKENNLPLTITGTGNQRRDFTHISDICDGLMAMSRNHWNAEIFNLGRSHNYSINEVAKMFQPKEIIYVPSRKGEAQDTLADITKSKELLNWEPKHNLPDYINSFLDDLNQ